MVSVTTEYISVGGNRHSAAADWDVQSGILAFGADNNIALWDPRDTSHHGVYSLLSGHADKVTAVRFHRCPSTGTSVLLTGSVDRTIRLWRSDPDNARRFTHACTLEGHEGSINTIAVADGTDIFASGAADGTVKVWRLTLRESSAGEPLKTISMKPRFFPLALSLKRLQTSEDDQSMLLAVAGTTNVVQIYVADNLLVDADFRLGAALTGHEGWVRSLSFTIDRRSKTHDLLLASASQDKYTRLWRVQRGGVAPIALADEDPMLGGMEPTLSNKAHEFEAAGSKYSITFEALLFGNEDWIYTVAWNPDSQRTQLLTASADNTLTIWEPDPVSGVWFSTERMGEMSVQKGSTSATGSTGGFWIGLWSPDGKQVVCLGRTGSWRAWKYDEHAEIWVQALGISGHVRSVNDIQWDVNGGYLLSTSSDQTTRLHAEWLRDGLQSWHEFSRPQIHGYDLNCIDTLGSSRFVSGADEKLLRIFNQPKPIARLLEKLSGFRGSTEDLPDTAEIPVLGLSNKPIGEGVPLEEGGVGSSTTGQPQTTQSALFDLNHPPLEDHLARYTLWPEHEKLYGHGYEISAVAVSHDRTLIATACKASSIDHAVIRLYDTSDWHEIKPSLVAHSLTITSLCFSGDDHYLLSVGRDRQWAVFERNEQDLSSFSLFTSNPKGHSRMILGAAWAPMSEIPVFATAGRDKSVKIWKMEEDTFTCKSTASFKTSVTAISFLPTRQKGSFILATGEDSGEISIYQVENDSLELRNIAVVDKFISPSKTVTQLSWRPASSTEPDGVSDKEKQDGLSFELAVASEDISTRIYAIQNMHL
ncbi:hypothetical protein MPDQ_006412 [Monascus purpureus]|uniref:Elongator complex protein 2 n=1 Tax=Monascus purpureus TaxID=5098 RepID=A0A507QY34_MONPU|nr:hypothetical protein MPDQ_006412 [Monascus purpureus]BDD56472.1 hypothetical protein MAP00_001925 [Monascus purpureus]